MTAINNVGNYNLKNQPTVVTNVPNNVKKMNFKANNDKFVKQPSVLDQQANIRRALEEQEKEQKKAKRKQNLTWGLGIGASLVLILALGGPMLTSLFSKEGKKLKELTKKVAQIKDEVIKREAEEELARQAHERSLYRVADLIELDRLASTTEKRTPAKIGVVEKALGKKIIGQEKAKQPTIDFLEAMNYDINNDIVANRPIIYAIDGPPGTCKSTLMQETADALGMYLKKISLNNIEKPGSLVGFERTYVGAKAGAFATGQLEGGTKKVFFMLDELEKAPVEVQNALLSLLDDQAKFKDLYYNCEIDLSQSIFGITTNELERLKGTALYDRIKPFVIKVTGYNNETKAKIAKLKLENALKEFKMLEKVEIKDDIYRIIAESTTDQGGRETTQIAEKKLVQELKKLLNYKKPGEKIVVDKTFIEKFLEANKQV